MSKIFIIGIVASGKTTLAKQLSTELNIPWYELDNIVHHRTESGRITRSKEQLIEILHAIDQGRDWILEGVYRESYASFISKADILIYLDTALWKCKFRILLRFIKQNLGLEKCEYDSSLHMLKMMYKWTNQFEKNRKRFEAMLQQCHSHPITIRNKADMTEMKRFLIEEKNKMNESAPN